MLESGPGVVEYLRVDARVVWFGHPETSVCTRGRGVPGLSHGMGTVEPEAEIDRRPRLGDPGDARGHPVLFRLALGAVGREPCARDSPASPLTVSSPTSRNGRIATFSGPASQRSGSSPGGRPSPRPASALARSPAEMGGRRGRAQGFLQLDHVVPPLPVRQRPQQRGARRTLSANAAQISRSRCARPGRRPTRPRPTPPLLAAR